MPSLSTKIMPSYYLLLLIHKEYIQITTFVTGIKNIDKIYLNVKKINVFKETGSWNRIISCAEGAHNKKVRQVESHLIAF